MNNIKCDCKGCVNRYAGCHAACESYKQYKMKVDALNAAKHEELRLYYDIKASRRTRKY